MIRLFHHCRLSWIALAAIVGTLSMVGESSGCESKVAQKTSRSCCAMRPSADCGCCDPAGDSPEIAKHEHASAGVGLGVGLVLPERSCACEPDEPSAPSPKPESQPTQSRANQAREYETEGAFAFEARTADTFAPHSPRRDGPPKTPLYLRTSRFLI